MVTIDPPFAKNDTFKKAEDGKDMIKPALTPAELETEERLLAHWGISNPAQALEKGIVWPESGYSDIWSWEKDIQESWLKRLEMNYAGVSALIDSTRYVHSDSVAAYLCYMAVRLIEIRRVLKPTGSLILHCDRTANGYLRQLLDGVFGQENMQNEIVWYYTNASRGKRRLAKSHDTLFWYSKSEEYTFNRDDILVPFASGMTKWRYEKGGQSGKEMPKGKTPDDVLILPSLNAMDKERAGYPTQKPVALAQWLIKAGTSPNDVVLDCFAGCAYAAIAAEKEGRQWVACDINPRAWTVFKRQFNKPKLGMMLRCHDETTGQRLISDEHVVTVHGPSELPKRASEREDTEPEPFTLPKRKFRNPASIIPEPVMLDELLRLSHYMAWCCGFANRRDDGSIVKTTRNFHLDHIDPKSKEGSNQITNRAPLCPHHNIRKGDKRIHLRDYREEIAHAGEMMVSRADELVDLAWAYEQALDLYFDERRRRGDQPSLTNR